MLQHQPLALGGVGHLAGTRRASCPPVDANEGGVDLVFTLVDVLTSRTVGGWDMRGQHPAKAIRRAGGAAFPEFVDGFGCSPMRKRVGKHRVLAVADSSPEAHVPRSSLAPS